MPLFSCETQLFLLVDMANFSAGYQGRKLHLLLGGRDHVLRPHTQLLPERLRLQIHQQEQQKAEL